MIIMEKSIHVIVPLVHGRDDKPTGHEGKAYDWVNVEVGVFIETNVKLAGVQYELALVPSLIAGVTKVKKASPSVCDFYEYTESAVDVSKQFACVVERNSGAFLFELYIATCRSERDLLNTLNLRVEHRYEGTTRNVLGEEVMRSLAERKNAMSIKVGDRIRRPI